MRGRMRVTGYSERGAVNALFYDLVHSGEPLHLLGQLLGLAGFSVPEQLGTGLTDAHVLIEQSLSDFGDADAILLLDAGTSKAAEEESHQRPRSPTAIAQ